ncbi:MAG: aminopeptidase, partial [Oscillospiraceae bacterium]|nr:aminopeptidase [Oscillospiraceae bacterium]
MDAKELKSKLLMEKKNGYAALSEADRKAMNEYCEGYKAYLDAGKTERECVTEAIRLAEAQGFKKLERGMELKAGDKVYANNRGKMLTLAVIGT